MRPMIIDAHAHIFPEVHGLTGAGPTHSLGYGRVAQGKEKVQLLPPYCEKTLFTAEMLIANMDWAGVDKAILLQGPFYGDCNPYVSQALNQYPDRFVGAAYADPWAPDSQNALLQILDSSAFRAVKLECSVASGLYGIHPEAELGSPDLIWLWEELLKRGMVLVLDLGRVGSRSYQTGSVYTLARKYPDLKIVIAHLAQISPEVEMNAEMLRLWSNQIDLGRLPNVWFDTASLPAYLPQEDFPFPTAGRYLRMAIEQIGPSKVLWGTDTPGLLTSASYPQLVKMAELHTGFLSPTEKTMVLEKNARWVYSIKDSSGSRF
jgi:predicted TIM-barrel fold metal-dependent hydrolase